MYSKKKHLLHAAVILTILWAAGRVSLQCAAASSYITHNRCAITDTGQDCHVWLPKSVTLIDRLKWNWLLDYFKEKVHMNVGHVVPVVCYLLFVASHWMYPEDMSVPRDVSRWASCRNCMFWIREHWYMYLYWWFGCQENIIPSVRGWLLRDQTLKDIQSISSVWNIPKHVVKTNCTQVNC